MDRLDIQKRGQDHLVSNKNKEKNHPQPRLRENKMKQFAWC